MKYFPEIVRILERFRERRTDTVDTDFRGQTDNKEFLLYDGIRSGSFPTDLDAADALYELTPTDTRYSSTKNRLKVRMLNSLFHLNLRRAGFSESAQGYYAVHRSALTVHILIMLGADRVGKHIAERTLRQAEKFALTDVALSMAILLRRLAGNMAQPKEFDKYDHLVKKLFRAYEEELISFEYSERTFTLLWRHFGMLSKYLPEMVTFKTELQNMLSESSTYNFQLNYHRISVMTNNASNKPAEVIDAAQKGIAFLESFPALLQKARVGEFWMYQLNSYMDIQDFESAKLAVEECSRLFNQGTNGWFSFMQPYFCLQMNTLHFEDAEKLYTEVTTHPRFSAQGDILQERFDIYKFYLNFGLRTLPNYDAKTQPHRLNFDAMIDRATESKRDKPGMNMALRYAQVLHLFDMHDYDPIDNLIEPIQNYRSRYITAADTEQSTIFFRLIKIMVKWSFQYKPCLKYGMKLHNQLKTQKFERIDQNQEVQILPYAWLWDHMLERMKERESGTKR